MADKELKKLSDLEICQKIALIEGANKAGIVELDGVKSLTAWFCLGEGFSYKEPVAHYNYNPLQDDALCFKLMIKYEITREYEHYDLIGWNYHSNNDADKEHITERTYWGEGEHTEDISPNKAICLAIIKSKQTGE